jgi:hypothetical protein
MNSVKVLCEPRPSVFDSSKRDTVLDLTDLADFIDGRVGSKIKPGEFFEENEVTEGIHTLLFEGFRRLEGRSSQGVFKLTQAMGGGKTHSMLVFGLLAHEPSLRESVMSHIYKAEGLGRVRVVAFSGRESDAPLGIWGAIAEQLGKRDLFREYYSPLQAPGQKAWINLLKGDPTLILLDELPPYFVAAKSKMIGNSDLAQVTAIALSNLLVAIGKGELSQVCLVISDLTDSYRGGESADRIGPSRPDEGDRPERHELGTGPHQHRRVLPNPAQADLREATGGGQGRDRRPRVRQVHPRRLAEGPMPKSGDQVRGVG